ncbi:hypothetical protein IAU60_006240 [Kwoniella sp. DSM 27419]
MPKNPSIIRLYQYSLLAFASSSFVVGSRWTWLLPHLANLVLVLVTAQHCLTTRSLRTGGRPPIFSPAPRAKYDAWVAQHKKYAGQDGKERARARYIEIAKRIGWDGAVREDEDIDLENLDAEEPTSSTSSGTNAMGGVKGYTALHLAADRGYAEMVEYLLRAGADRHLKDEDDQTALALAEISGRTEIVALLQ